MYTVLKCIINFSSIKLTDLHTVQEFCNLMKKSVMHVGLELKCTIKAKRSVENTYRRSLFKTMY